jgi:hypothetical protein
MNCKDFESMIHEIVSRPMADKTRQLEALEHAGRCLWCAVRLDEESKLTESLRVFARTLHGQCAPARVEKALLQAFRETTGRATTSNLGLAGKRFWRRLSWGLAFAATLATAWVVIWQARRLHSRSSVSPPQAANHQPLASSELSHANGEQPGASEHGTGQVKAQSTGGKSLVAARQSLELGSPNSTNRERAASIPDHRPGHSGTQVVPRGRPERAALDESASEVTTDFISLGTCDDSQCMDEATLVRVTLPAEALLMFGLPMDNDFSTGEPVEADVLLASDGLPFAIRFVN